MKIVLDAGMQIAKRRAFRVQTANKKKKKTSSAAANKDGNVEQDDEQEDDIANNSNDEDENAQVAASMIALSAAVRETNAPIHAQDGEVLDETRRESQSESIVCATCRETKNIECYTTRMVQLYNKHTLEGKTVYPRCIECIDAAKEKNGRERAWRYNLGLLNMSELAMIGSNSKARKLKQLRHLLDFATQVNIRVVADTGC